MPGRIRAAAWLALLLLGAAQAPPLRVQAFSEHPVRAEIIAEHASVPPGGRTRLGVHFELEEGWHIYADPPGDAGLPTKVKWAAPRDLKVGPLSWPAPEDFLDPGNIHTRGYSGMVVLSSAVQVGGSAKPGSALSVRANVEWLACKEICIPGSAKLDLALPVQAGPQAFSTHAELFEQLH